MKTVLAAIILLMAIGFTSEAPAQVRWGVDIHLGTPPPPPPPRREIIIERPYSEAVWVPGYWSFNRPHRHYYWVPGRWNSPVYRHWESPRWNRGHGYSHDYDHGHDHDRKYGHGRIPGGRWR